MQKYPISYSILVFIGIYFIYGVIRKPNFFWESKGTIRIRNVFGDNRARSFYILIGSFLIMLGIILMDL
ncbi:hypothetical protein KQI88_14795 [Alkaliphilus sp. MSJ-5]|uniref:Immunity protein 17 n=1 Tax=Alkaliphilus flagellatus TaxID=2841507 RepID=A0ABS6G8G7_9FIRM|nr:hypothetical protein [Alkaliphilus flagellatus]